MSIIDSINSQDTFTHLIPDRFSGKHNNANLIKEYFFSFYQYKKKTSTLQKIHYMVNSVAAPIIVFHENLFNSFQLLHLFMVLINFLLLSQFSLIYRFAFNN